MLVKFIYGSRLEETAEWVLDAVPRVGDYISLDDKARGKVHEIRWRLTTKSRPAQCVDVILIS